jgi:capsular polysaccharide biosynthesis protein
VEDLLQDDEQHLVVSDALRRYWLVIVISTVVFGLVGGLYAFSRKTEYTSTAKVLIRAIAGNPLSPDATSTSQQVTLAMTTEAGVVTSPAVVAIVSKKLDATLQAGTKVIQASVVPNTEILEIKYTAGTSSDAESGAQATADSFLEYRESRATGTVAQTIKRLEAQIRTVQAQVKHAAASAGQVNAPVNAASQLQIYTSRLESLQASVQELQVTDPNPGTVVTPAGRPGSPAGLNPLIYLVGAAMFGLGASIIGAVWRARNDERVRGRSDGSVHGLPVLASLPTNQASHNALIDVTVPGELNEAFRRLRTGILVGVNRPAVIVMSSTTANVSSGPLAENLGLSLNDAGFRVCVVDAELEWSVARDRLGAGSKTTLASVLADEDFHAASLDRDHGIGVIPAGPDSAGLRDQLASTRFRAVVQGLRRNNDYVVVAAPPASLADGGTVALASDQVILAVVDRQTTRDEVYSIGDRFGRLNVHIMGLIVTPHPSWWRRLTRRGPTAPARTGTSTAAVSAARSKDRRKLSTRRRGSKAETAEAKPVERSPLGTSTVQTGRRRSLEDKTAADQISAGKAATSDDSSGKDQPEVTKDKDGQLVESDAAHAAHVGADHDDAAAVDEIGVDDAAEVDQQAIDLEETELEEADKKAVSTGAASRDD